MSSETETVRQGFVAGVAGGFAEIAWVALYAGITGGDAAMLAKGVTSAAGVSALLPSSPVMLGIIVHMSLAVIVGLLLAFAWRELRVQWPSLRSPLSVCPCGARRHLGAEFLHRAADCQPCVRSLAALPSQSDFETLVWHRRRGSATMPDGTLIRWIAAKFPVQAAPGSIGKRRSWPVCSMTHLRSRSSCCLRCVRHENRSSL